MTRELTLGREERLRNNLSIQELLKHGRTVSLFPLKIYWNLSADPRQKYPARAAVSVPRRKYRKAVERNLMKRRLKEAYRLNKYMLYDPLDRRQLKIHLIILLLSDEFIPFAQLETNMRGIFRKLLDKLS